MMRSTIAAAMAALALSGAASAQVPQWQPHVLILGSMDELPAWVSKDGAERAGAGRLRIVPAGQKIYFPIAVSGVAPSAEMRLTADLEFLGPKGQVLWSRKACCEATVGGNAAPEVVALGGVADVMFEPGDTAGNYTVRAIVSDGRRTATATETFRYGTDGAPAAPYTGPRLQMDAPKKNPGADRDVRDCLELPSSAEIIKCTERAKKAK